MRGYLQPAKKSSPSENQTAFATMPRGRRVKLAKVAQTNLLKADQWARGEAVDAALSDALEGAFSAHAKKKK
jgi:hypothetical protein